MVSSYANYIATDYVSRLAAYAPECKEFAASLAGLALAGKVDDSTLYKMANGYATAFDKMHHEKPKEYNMVPFVQSNGVIRYVDMNGHGELTIIPRGKGLYAISGPEKMFEIVGGRGMLSTFIQNLDDGDFFHNKKA